MATFAEQMVAKVEETLLANVGATSVTVDGVTVAYDDLVKQRAYWANQVDREQGKRPRAATIQLGGV